VLSVLSSDLYHKNPPDKILACNSLKTLKHYTMENANFIENIATRLGQNATVKNVYGDPVVAGDKTIIPVAQVALGFGGGYGKNPKKFLKQGSSDYNHDDKGGEGLGGGGGMYARPKGVYEISPEGTKFIPANYTRQLLIAALAGFFIRSLLTRRKK
jgi:uncharacterized spore protein YtfJ